VSRALDGGSFAGMFPIKSKAATGTPANRAGPEAPASKLIGHNGTPCDPCLYY
jgi:hypothetical protein